MRVTIKMNPSVAQEWHRGRGDHPAVEELRRTARELGVALAPLHPGIEDPDLASYFYAEAPSRDAAEAIAVRLRENPAIEGAYAKPRDSPP